MNLPPSNIGDGDLTVTNILRHGSTWHSRRKVRTVGADHTEMLYGDFAGRAAALANGLASLGVGPGAVVGSMLWNTREHLEAYFGVPSMGALLHTINPRLSAEQISYTINHAGDDVIIVDASFLPQLLGVLERIPDVRTLIVVGDMDGADIGGVDRDVVAYEDLLAGQPTEYAWPDIDERAGATLCYTTGTTGDPKGVAYSHRSIWIHALSLCTANAVGLSARDNGYIVVPMFHANAWGYPYATFWAGGDLLLCNRDLDPATIVGAVERYRPTFSNGVPTVWNDVLRHLEADPSRDLGSLDRVILGGAPIPEALRVGLDRYGVTALQGWGMTETSPLVTLNRPPRSEDDDDSPVRAGCQGRILSGVEVRIVDPEGEQVLPADGRTVGELELRGPWIADSYFGGAGEEKFHDGWLRTGDVGTLDPLGYVHLTDRAKDVIKSGGEWISSVELELTIAKHPDVVDAAVIGVPDERWDERPCAFVVLADRPDVRLDDVKAALSESVPKWWIPERWVQVEQLPLTSVGKYDKKAMRGLYADGEVEVRRPS